MTAREESCNEPAICGLQCAGFLCEGIEISAHEVYLEVGTEKQQVSKRLKVDSA